MVTGTHLFGAVCAILFAAQHAGDAVLERLDPPRRAAVVMALLGLTLVGLFMIAFIMIGGHWVRKLARHRPGRRGIEKGLMTEGQLHEAFQNALPDLRTSDTMLLDTSSNDTKIGS